MKTAIRITLLSFWICTLTVPSFVTILNSNDDPILVINLNEEEQQEQLKKDIEEKQITYYASSIMPNAQLKKTADADHYLISTSNMMTEIVLPPPELAI